MREFTTPMRRTRYVAALMLSASLPALAFSAKDFTRYIPGDAVIAGWANDVPELTESAKASPYGQLWADPAFDPMRVMIEKEYLERTMTDLGAGSAIGDLYTNLKGGAAFYMLPEGGNFTPEALSITAVVELTEESRPWFEERVTLVPELFEEVKKDTFETGGVTVYRLSGSLAGDELQHSEVEGSPKTIMYAFTDEFFIVSDSFSEEPIKQSIRMIQGDPGTIAFGADERLRIYQQRRSFTDQQFHIFVDTQRLITEGIDSSPTITPELRSALPETGLYDLEALFATATFSSKGVDMNVAMITPDNRRGLVETMHSMGPASLDSMAYAPSDALGITAFTLDGGRLYDDVLEVIRKMNPQAAALAQMAILSYQSSIGINVVDEVLRNLTGEHVVIQREFDEEIRSALTPEQLATQESIAVFFNLGNGEQTEASLKVLLESMANDPNRVGFVEVGEVSGITTAVFRLPGMDADSPLVPCIAFNRQKLVFANNQIQLRESIRALNGETISPISESQDFNRLITNLDRQNLYMFSYSPRAAVREGIDQIHELISMGLFPALQNIEKDVLPPSDVFLKYIGDSYSATYFDDRMFYVDIRVQSPPQ